MTHYAYIHARPDTTDLSGVFYVGKGAGRRFRPAIRRNRHHQNVVGKYGAENILVGKVECSSEAIAHELETGLIRCLRRAGVKLVNLTDGGEGSSGYRMPSGTKAVIAENSKRRWEDPEFKAKLSETQRRAQRDPACFTEKKQASSLRNAEAARAALQNPETREQARTKNSIKSREMWADPDFRDAMKVKHASLWTDERRKAKSLQVKGRIRMTDGTNERNVSPEDVEELLRQGWVKGRKPSTRKEY